jgi:hypothetical protein
MIRTRTALAVIAVLVLSGCSIAVEGKARASLFAPLNRETRSTPDSEVAERAIIAGLLAEAGGEDVLARSYLAAKGYSPEEQVLRITVVRASQVSIPAASR